MSQETKQFKATITNPETARAALRGTRMSLAERSELGAALAVRGYKLVLDYIPTSESVSVWEYPHRAMLTVQKGGDWDDVRNVERTYDHIIDVAEASDIVWAVRHIAQEKLGL